MLASFTGRLLVATPLLGDPNFERTVVFVCSHNEEGALGLVLNRVAPAKSSSTYYRQAAPGRESWWRRLTMRRARPSAPPLPLPRAEAEDDEAPAA